MNASILSSLTSRSFSLLRFAVVLAVPLVVSWLPVLWCHVFHVQFYSRGVTFAPWLALLALPPLAWELGFTWSYEARRYGWRWWVIGGVSLRCLAVLGCFWLFVWETLRHADTPNIVYPLLFLWPGVVRVAWSANPLLSATLGALLLLAYFFLTVKRRMLRLATTLLLPALATKVLFDLFYFFPEAPIPGSPGAHALRVASEDPRVEFVFPRGELPEELGPRLHPRDLFVRSDDRLVVGTYGRTFGSGNSNRPNLLRIDLGRDDFQKHRFDTIRRFETDDEDSVWFAPWHFARLYEYRVEADTITGYELPSKFNGFPVDEIMAVLHVGERDTVYAINNRNPVLFAWDTVERKLRGALDFTTVDGIRLGDSLGGMTRDGVNGRLFLFLIGRYHLAEVDEETLSVTRVRQLPREIVEIQVSPDGRTILAPAFFHNVVFKIETEYLSVVQSISAPMQCRTGVFTEDGGLFMLASYLTGELLVIDVEGGAVLERISVGPRPEGIARTAGYVYVSTAAGVVRVARATLPRVTGGDMDGDGGI